MNNILKFKDWLTIDQVALLISYKVFNEPVKEADVLRLGLDASPYTQLLI